MRKEPRDELYLAAEPVLEGTHVRTSEQVKNRG